MLKILKCGFGSLDDLKCILIAYECILMIHTVSLSTSGIMYTYESSRFQLKLNSFQNKRETIQGLTRYI